MYFIHNKYSDIWDSLSFYDMLSYSPPLSTIHNSLNGEVKKRWVRDLKTRMYREGLLGRNMF